MNEASEKTYVSHLRHAEILDLIAARSLRRGMYREAEETRLQAAAYRRKADELLRERESA